jgi:gliding motility-associated-like protein
MKKHFQYLLMPAFLLLFSNKSWATHNRAGEIRVEQTGPQSVRATVITYTKTSSVPADRDTLEICWGDGTCEKVARSNGRGEVLANDVKKNLYVATHTYPGRLTYRISMTDPNRNGGVLNVNFPHSDNIPFHIQTSISFLNTQFQGGNSTPQLLQPPIDRGCVDKLFIHNPNAFDADGDSLAYRLITPLQDVGSEVPRYEFPWQISPGGNNIMTLDPRTGTLRWEKPQQAGEYNIAIQIISYRRGVPIDTTIRDMQILVESCHNAPPKIESKDKFCVIAGQQLRFEVRATDQDVGQKVKLSALGGPFIVPVSPATFNNSTTFTTPPITSTFTWNTTCEHIEEQPYSVVFKATDNFFSDTTGLVDLKLVQIKVVGPPPEAVTALPHRDYTIISWKKPYICENAQNRYFYAFSVWRKEGSNPFARDTCTNGLDGKGYTRILIDTTFPIENGRYTFRDNTVQRGRTYCYRILAHFAKRTVANNPYNLVASLPSDEVCVQLNRDLPLIISASVTETSTTTGKIAVKWTKPLPNDLDTLLNPGPYRFQLFRATGITRTNLTPIAGASWRSPYFKGFNDTTFVDNNLNTLQNSYSYKVGFYTQGGDTLLGYSEVASSVYLKIASTDRINNLSWDKDVPWTNSHYVIYRRNPVTTQYDSIGISLITTFRDSNLTNGTEYCYYVKSVGTYGIASVESPLFNLSERLCGTPIDTVPPCVPVLGIKNDCDTTGLATNIINKLRWTNPKNNCRGSQDLASFKIYYVEKEGGALRLLASINNRNDTIFEHRNADGTIAGCYAVTAIDSVGNESLKSNLICVDNCPYYKLPNTFTPNGDGQNDVFKPLKNAFRYVEKVDFQVFNRWGEQVFQTTDPHLGWNGKNPNGDDLASGTYFYTCIVYEQRLQGVVQSQEVLKGFIELIR